MAVENNHDIRLKSRPNGLPTLADFTLTESPIPTPGVGQVLVKNLFVSVDPYMRGRMNDTASYVPPFQLGEVIQGGAIGKVVAGTAGDIQPGDYVRSFSGWREWFVADAEGLTKVDPAAAPLEAFLGALGMTGLTAYAGLTRIGGLKPEDRVLVSAAAGAVGSIACQIARNLGAQVVGIAGGAEKCAWLGERSIAAIDYRAVPDLAAAVAAALPAGVDLYFDNVGGSHLAAALANMRINGRIAACGMIEQYNVKDARGPANIVNIVGRRLRLQGFIVGDHVDLTEKFTRDMAGWIAAGKMVWRQTVVVGLENTPAAFIGLFTGANTGKMLVKVGEE
jgi:NADPH-dependent curcumin reductase CurA